MTITIPENFIPERSWTIETLFSGMLGITPRIETGSGRDTVIDLERRRRIIIRDAFFSGIDEGRGYLEPKHLPVRVGTLEGRFAPRTPLPVIFGPPAIEAGSTEVDCGADLIASAFFMLSRWEEAVDGELDEHRRFPSVRALAARCGFLERPIVDEYAELLRRMIASIGNTEPLVSRSFRFDISHDVDMIRYPFVPRGFAHDILRSRSIRKAWNRLVDTAGNAYDTFDALMRFSERRGARATFYFMAGGSSAYDNRYPLDDRLVLKRLSDIRSRGHRVGLHGSYGGYLDAQALAREREALERAYGQSVSECRMHYLRFRAPDTWRALRQAGIRGDATCGFQDRVGYRCGTGHPYPVFDVRARERLPLVERPLVCMDGALAAEGRTTDGVIAIIDGTVGRARSVGGCCSFLFHNSVYWAWRERGIDAHSVFEHLGTTLGAA